MQVDRLKLNEFLKKMRDDRGLSQRSLARHSREKAGEEGKALTHSHISKVESGEVNPNLQTLQKFAQVFEVLLVIVLDGGKADPDTVTLVSTDDVSQALLDALQREEVIELLLLCQQLPQEQIEHVISLLRSSAAIQSATDPKTSQT